MRLRLLLLACALALPSSVANALDCESSYQWLESRIQRAGSFVKDLGAGSRLRKLSAQASATARQKLAAEQPALAKLLATGDSAATERVDFLRGNREIYLTTKHYGPDNPYQRFLRADHDRFEASLEKIGEKIDRAAPAEIAMARNVDETILKEEDAWLSARNFPPLGQTVAEAKEARDGKVALELIQSMDARLKALGFDKEDRIFALRASLASRRGPQETFDFLRSLKNRLDAVRTAPGRALVLSDGENVAERFSREQVWELIGAALKGKRNADDAFGFIINFSALSHRAGAAPTAGFRIEWNFLLAGLAGSRDAEDAVALIKGLDMAVPADFYSQMSDSALKEVALARDLPEAEARSVAVEMARQMKAAGVESGHSVDRAILDAKLAGRPTAEVLDALGNSRDGATLMGQRSFFAAAIQSGRIGEDSREFARNLERSLSNSPLGGDAEKTKQLVAAALGGNWKAPDAVKRIEAFRERLAALGYDQDAQRDLVLAWLKGTSAPR